MGQRGNQQDIDGQAWHSIGVRLGQFGLDTREPSEPGALARLINARFEDDRTIVQRHGHTGRRVKDAANFPPLGPTARVTGDWVYGHGATVATDNAQAWENAHHPFPNKAEGVFSFDGADIMWTGDRLLVSREGEGVPALGRSTFWSRVASTTSSPQYGIPAFLPVQADSTPPSRVTGDYLQTCVTDSLRVFVHTASSELWAWVVDRETGAVVSSTEITGLSSNSPESPVVLSSNGVPVVLWLDTGVIYMAYWTGLTWSTPNNVASNVGAFDFALTAAGFVLAYRQQTPAAPAIKLLAFAGTAAQDVPFVGHTALADFPDDPSGALSLDVAPDGQIAVVADCSGTGLVARLYTADLTPRIAWTTVVGASGFTGGLSCRTRGLKNADSGYDIVVHASRGEATGVQIYSVAPDVSSETADVFTLTRQNSTLVSRSFRVGDEVFCWLRSGLAETCYLVGGGPKTQVCGYCDREEALDRSAYGLQYVLPDPLDELKFTWCRLYETGQTYARGGNVRVGDLDFLPALTTARFGKSVYLSGCNVRNWDGVELGDAGFHDYPVVSAAAEGTGGSLTALGTYRYRVYAVRYNARGERFKSAAVTYTAATLTGSNNALTLTIKTLPSTNHTDIRYEVYRTEDGGTTYYAEGTVAHNGDAATVSFVSGSISDADLISNEADPHQTGVGQLAEVEEFGPLGCTILATSGDRLWTAGGQVPKGVVQFSKLKEDGEGAGFDALAGFVTADIEGQDITAIHPLNDTTAIHQRRRLFIVAGTGPDNYGRGSFSVPQIVLADGAAHQAGVGLNQLGAVYWGVDGPRLLTVSFRVLNISAPVRTISEGLEPSGVLVRPEDHEVVWFTRDGTALLWNYLTDGGRWAQWTGLKVAAVSDEGTMAMTDGRLFYRDPDAVGDDGQGFEFLWRMANLRGEQLLQGYHSLRSIGVVGAHKGPHQLRFRVFYDGAPLWAEEWVWSPQEDTWLSSVEDVEDLTPAQVDALATRGRSGSYQTHKRVARHQCTHFAVEVSNIDADGPTYIPYELSLELGSRGGLGRTPPSTFATTVGR